jgi:hypothetical protein
MHKREIAKRIAVCDGTHGATTNTAVVYGHFANLRNRNCIRIVGTDIWIYSKEA